MVKSMLLINSSNVLELPNLTNPLASPIYVNEATVTVAILDSAGVELAGVSWPQNLPYVAGSNGTYRETFAPFTALKDGETYTIVFDIVGADTKTLQIKKREKAGFSISC